MNTTDFRSSDVIGRLLSDGLDAALQQYPELMDQRGLLEELLAAHMRLSDLEREAGDLNRRLDRLGGELADHLGELKPVSKRKPAKVQPK